MASDPCIARLKSLTRDWLHSWGGRNSELLHKLLATDGCDDVCDLSRYREQVRRRLDRTGATRRVMNLQPTLEDAPCCAVSSASTPCRSC